MKIQTLIEQKLKDGLNPVHLDITNESHMHNVPADSESHFKVVLASAAFEGKRQVQRHQAIYGLLKEELAGEVHALALHTFSPEEWQQSQTVPDSPDCLGGS